MRRSTDNGNQIPGCEPFNPLIEKHLKDVLKKSSFTNNLVTYTRNLRTQRSRVIRGTEDISHPIVPGLKKAPRCFVSDLTGLQRICTFFNPIGAEIPLRLVV